MEPENQHGLVSFLETVKARYPEKSIWCHTGDTYEELTSGPKRTEDTDRLLSFIDILVDGPFVQDLKDITLRFRGSSNQRIIDMAATRATGKVVLWTDDPVLDAHDELAENSACLFNEVFSAVRLGRRAARLIGRITVDIACNTWGRVKNQAPFRSCSPHGL